MRTLFPRPLAAAALFALAAAAHATPTSVSTGNVDIQYDRDTFVFNRDTGSGTEPIDPASVPLSFFGNSVTLDFGGALSVYGSAYGFSAQSAFGDYFASFDFAAQAGYAITGYTVRYTGSYSIETPGDVNLGGTGIALSESTGAGTFDVTAAIAAPYLSGTLNANGYITSVQVLDHYEQVLDHYEQVLDYCDDNGCYYRDEPVYIDVPVYRDETDLGEAQLSLQTITVTANVAAVPEPQTYAMLLAGLGVMTLIARRRRH